MIEKLASQLNRRDEEPNIELAKELAQTKNIEGITEIVNGFKGKNKAIANDCIKVLYELGEINPNLIKDYATDFIEMLSSKNNRIVWGSMTALAIIADLVPDVIFKEIDKIEHVFKNGSVIAVDNSVTVLAKIASSNKKYEKVIFPLLINHIKTTRAKEIPQHAQRMLVCINKENVNDFLEAIESRKNEMTASQLSRIKKLEKSLNTL